MEDRTETGKRQKVKYNVLLVPDRSTEAVRQISINLQMIKMFMAAVILLIMAALIYCVVLTRELNESKGNVLVLQIEIESLTRQKEMLISQKVEQNKKIAVLNDTLNDKMQQEEQREAEIAKTYIPSGFPVKGTASYDETEVELEGNPIAMFHVPVGTSVTATANGVVSSVEGSNATGYVVTVNHGNGYITIYRNGTQPKIKEGADVTKETEIFHIETGNENLGYQILEKDKYIDPLSFMEVYG